MPLQKIITIPNPILYQKSEEVKKFDRNLRNLVRDMFDSMYAHNGVGLAAVQIGVLKRVLVIDLQETYNVKGVFINPRVREVSTDMQEGDEGCLSVPGLSLPLVRPRWVKVSYQNLSGQSLTIEGENLLARAFLHEMDHLDGKVFVDLLEPHILNSAREDIERVAQGKPPRYMEGEQTKKLV